jgi:hypothetical protein
MSFLVFLIVLVSSGQPVKSFETLYVHHLDHFDAPRPYLSDAEYMKRVFVQAKKSGATKRQMQRLYRIAHEETKNSPRACGKNGCGPFQQRVRSLSERYVNTEYVRNWFRWLLTNKPGFAATTALDMLQRCENLSGEYWRCCYGGAYRSECRIKWDKKYRKEQEEKT